MHAARSERGFTLLEVLLAFAILSILTSLLTELVANNVARAADAIDKRELREIADTVFGKILFEQTDHRDGDDGSIAVAYGDWANLPQERRDRYSMYRWRLKKTELVAAGTSEDTDDAESMFGDPGDDDETSSSGTESEEEKGKAAVKLVRFTLIVYRESEPGEALATLTRYLPPPDFEGTSGTSGSSGSSGR